MKPHSGEARTFGHGGLQVVWTMGDGSRLMLITNLDDRDSEGLPPPEGEPIFESRPGTSSLELQQGRLPAWTTLWFLQEPSRQ